MFWIILGVIVSIIITVAIIKSDDFIDFGDRLLFWVLYQVVTCFGVLILYFIVSSGLTLVANVDYELQEDIEIVALKDNLNINGSYYLFSGYYDEDLYYYYASKKEFGYKTEKVRASNAYVQYTDENPHMETYNARFSKKFLHFFGSPLVNDRYIIYCPQGTITNEFVVDLE